MTLINNLMNTRDAAMFWGVSQRQVCRLCASGRVQSAVKINGRWFMHPMAAKPFDRRFKKPSFRLVKVLWSKDGVSYGRCQHNCPEYTIIDGLVKIIDANDYIGYMKEWGLSGGQRSVTAAA